MRPELVLLLIERNSFSVNEREEKCFATASNALVSTDPLNAEMDLAELQKRVEAAGAHIPSEELFNSTAERAKDLKNLSDNQRLQLYGLFKQSTVGNVNTSRPWSINVVDAAKWCVECP